MTAAFANIRIGPANLQVVVVTGMLLTCAVLRREQVVISLGWQVMAILGMGIVFIPFKMLAGLLHPAGLQSMRLFFILPLVWALYASYVADDRTRSRVATIIIWNCVFVALFGLVHFFIFPSVYLGYATTEMPAGLKIAIIPGHFQEAAFFGNPSAYGAILVAGMFAIYLTHRKSLPYVLAFFVMALGALVSVSRAALAFTGLLVVVYLASGISLTRLRGWLPVIALGAGIWYVFMTVPFFGFAVQAAAHRLGLYNVGTGEVLGSFGESVTGGRFPGYQVGLRVLFKDFSHIFIGSGDTEDIVIGDINFSDNSFIFLGLTFGVPLAALWITTVLRRTVPLTLRGGIPHLLLLFFIYATLFTTPSIGWDMWLVYAIGLLFVMPEVPVRVRAAPVHRRPATMGTPGLVTR
jgi:hypothetical protein